LKNVVWGLLPAVCVIVGAASARANVVTAFLDPATVGNQNWGGTLGLEFNVVNPIWVTALGTFDSGQNGIGGAVTVTIYDRTTQSPVSGLSLAITGTQGFLVGGDRFVTLLTPVLLPAGFQGTVGGVGYGSGLDPNGNTTLGGFGPVTVDNGGGLIALVDSRYSNSSGYPTLFDGTAAAYGAGTFQFSDASAAPEPGTLGGVMLAVAAAGWWRRRREGTD
jgi:hypothetical protein